MKFIQDYQKASPEQKKIIMDNYQTMQKMRMSVYDFSDVAYDAFLLNSQSNTHPWTAPVKINDVVRLRFVGASASTNFRVKVAGATLKIVQVDGNNVKPYEATDFAITPGETYDALVTIKKDQPYIIYAESADRVGAAYGALLTQPNQTVDVQSVSTFPEPLFVTQELPFIPSLIAHPDGAPAGLYAANFLDISNDFARNVQEINFKGLYGSDNNKLELYIDNAQMEKGTVGNTDLDVFYWHLISQFWAIKTGMNYFYRPTVHPYWQPGVGIEGLMPYFIDTNIRSYLHAGSTKFDIELSRDTQITNNFFLNLGIENIFATKTVQTAGIGSGMNETQYTIRPHYRLKPWMDLFAQYEYTKDYGALANFDQQYENQSPRQSTLMLGVSLLF